MKSFLSLIQGHSTGGAVASFVVISLLDRLRGLLPSYIQSAVKCITFGMTPFGDKGLRQFVESISATKELFCHIVKDDDIIPKLFGSNLADVQVGWTKSNCFSLTTFQIIWKVLYTKTLIEKRGKGLLKFNGFCPVLWIN